MRRAGTFGEERRWGLAASLWDTHHVLFLDGGGVGEAPWDKAMATHPSILDWRDPWAEEPGGLQSMGSHRVKHD